MPGIGSRTRSLIREVNKTMPVGDGRDINGWSEYRRLVTKGLEDLSESQERLEEKFQTFQVQLARDIAVLKTKASTWGSVAGVIAGFIISIIVELVVHTLLRK